MGCLFILQMTIHVQPQTELVELAIWLEQAGSPATVYSRWCLETLIERCSAFLVIEVFERSVIVIAPVGCEIRFSQGFLHRKCSKFVPFRIAVLGVVR